jgi:hypothetical protein
VDASTRGAGRQDRGQGTQRRSPGGRPETGGAKFQNNPFADLLKKA